MSPNATGNVVRDNIIGESPLGQAAPVGRYGIVVRNNTRSHVIEGNTIRNAGVYGIGLIQQDVLWVRLSRNIVTDMSGPALYFAADPHDATHGADNLVSPPEISSATRFQVSGTGSAGATVEVYHASRAAGKIGLPDAFLGSATIAGNGTWSVGVSVQQGDRVTALQILPSNNTSNLAPNVTADAGTPPGAPSAAFSASQEPGTLKVDFSDTSTGSPSSWSWTFGDGATSSQQNPSHTYSAAGDYTVSLTASNAGGPNTTSKTVSVVNPPPAGVIAADSFGRATSASWGSADAGGNYSLSGNTSNYAVGSGVGTIVVPKAGASRAALLNTPSAADVDITFRVATDQVAAGGPSFIYAVARRNGNSEYRPRLILNANGTVSVNASVLVNGSESSLGTAVVVPGLSQSANSFIWFRAQVTGSGPTTIKVKAWAAGTSEPSGWNFSTTANQAALQSAGSLGLRVYAASHASNTPITFSFDDYSVTPAVVAPPPPAGVIAADSFGRATSASWGSADAGGNYSLSGNTSNYAVGSGVGTIVVPKAGASRAALLNTPSAADVDITFRVATDQVAAGGPSFIYAVARRNGNSEYRPRLILNANGTVSVNASVLVNGSESSLGTAVVVPGLSQSANSFIWFRAQVTGSGPTTIKVKAWAAGTSEPSGWNFSTTDNQAALQSAGSLGLRVYAASHASNTPITFSFDDYAVGAP